jgi:hypothetical protein
VNVLQIKQNTLCRKYKETAHMFLVAHPISQPSLDISPIWTPIIAAEVKKTAIPYVVDYVGKLCCYTGSTWNLSL